jgi:ribosomal protein S18 acetylase RimI-like enzyme
VRFEIGAATADDVERILATLPEWFGIESAVRDYVEYARSHEVQGAHVDGHVVGILVMRRHNQASTEVHLLAVEPDLHRRGIGSALLDAAERRLREDGTAILHVKTLGPSEPSDEYARTRAFYEARGFIPMEERTDLWPGNPALLMVKPLIVG